MDHRDLDRFIFEGLHDEVERKYDPERDVIPGGPLVTWADRQLLDLVRLLEERVRQLEDYLKMEVQQERRPDRLPE